MSTRTWIVAIGLCAFVTASGAYAAAALVSQKGKIFTPDELTQGSGSTLRIDNDDTIPHNVQVTTPDGENRNMGMQKPGEFADVVLDKSGDFMVRCGIHPKMKLVIHAR